MNRFVARMRARGEHSDGLTLIEVVVAMAIFTIIATGLLYTMMSVLALSRDSRARQVATNLAAEEIDLVRDYADVFQVSDSSRSETRNKDVFQVIRSTEWESAGGTGAACGAGAGVLRYKRVHVTVEWENMRRGSEPVTSDTLLNPNSRINDPEKGTILVSVKTAANEGAAGVPVWAKKAGGTTLTKTTDSKGCAYFLMADPGTYQVGLTSPSGSNYVDFEGQIAPTKSNVVVEASKTRSEEFSYDRAGILNVSYVDGASTYLIPRDLDTTLFSTRDPVVSKVATLTNPASLHVFPWGDGNSLVAGDAKKCQANDPEAWPASGSLAAGVRPGSVAVESGAQAPATVPAGAVTVSGLNNSNRYLTAVSQNTGPLVGQPACTTQPPPYLPLTYTFNQLPSGTTSVTVALPFGSWRLYSGNSVGSTSNAISNLTVISQGTKSGFVVTFDPRGSI